MNEVSDHPELAELERQLKDAKLQAVIHAHGPFAAHAQQRVRRIKADITRCYNRYRNDHVVDITDDHPDLNHLD